MAGFFNWVTQGLKNNLERRDAGSSQEYQNAFNAANESINKTQNLADQYTGNAGYQNSLQQAGQGAALLANQAVGQGISGARSAGMSKAQAAAMGNQLANNAYAQNFQNQQGNAMGMGNQSIQAQQGITSAQQGQTGQAANEKNQVWSRATQNDPFNKIGSMAQTGFGLIKGTV